MIPWTVAYQVPLTMGFPRQAHWSGLPLEATRKAQFLNTQSEIVDLLGNRSKEFHRRGIYHKGKVNQLFVLIYLARCCYRTDVQKELIIFRIELLSNSLLYYA